MANGPLPHDVFSNDVGHIAEKSPIIFADSENIRIFAGQKRISMTTNVLSAPSPISAKSWSELKELSDNVKLELITLLSRSMSHTETAARPNGNERLEAALRSFSKDWGGDGSAQDIANDLRRNVVNDRTVETW